MQKIAIAIIALLVSPLAWSQRSAGSAFTIGIDVGEVELGNYAEFCANAKAHIEDAELNEAANSALTKPLRAGGPCADIQYSTRLFAALRVNDWITAKGSYTSLDTFSSSHNITSMVSGDVGRYMGGLGSFDTELSLLQASLQGEYELSPDGLHVAGLAGLRNYDLETTFTHAYHEEIPDDANDLDNPSDKVVLEGNRAKLELHDMSATKAQRTVSGTVLLLGAAVENEANKNLTGAIHANLAYDLETEETGVEWGVAADWHVIGGASLRLGYEQLKAGPEDLSQTFIGANYGLEF